MTDLNDMVVFAQVVAASGFAETARRLSVSKSTISKSITRLEEALGVRLLNRSTRGMSLTEVGAAYYEHCVRIAEEAAKAAELVGELRSQPRGVLKITCPVAFGRLHVAPAVADYLALHPQVRIDLTTTDRMVDLVSEGFDIAIRIRDEPNPQLVAHELAMVHRVMCATPGYFARFGTPATPQDLAGHNCLHYTHFGTHGQWRLQGRDGPVVVPVSGSLRVNDDDFLARAVLDGLGIALLPTFIIGRQLRAGVLQAVLPDFVPLDRHILVAHLPNVHLPAKVSGFIDFLQARIGEVPYWDRPGNPAISAEEAPVN